MNELKNLFQRAFWESRNAWYCMGAALAVALLGDLAVRLWWVLGVVCLVLVFVLMLLGGFLMLQWLWDDPLDWEDTRE